MNKQNLLFNLDNPEYCKKLIDEYDSLRKSVSRNSEYFNELIKTNSEGLSHEEILQKARQYFPIVDKSYTRILSAFRQLFKDDNLEFKEIRKKLSRLILDEHEERCTGVNKINNDFLESIGIKPELGGKYTSSELGVFSSSFLLMEACRDMLSKLSTIYALCGEEYYTEGETEEGFQY